jgi:hypothetical protein
MIAAWHRELGATEQNVTLDAKASAQLELTYTRSK